MHLPILVSSASGVLGKLFGSTVISEIFRTLILASLGLRVWSCFCDDKMEVVVVLVFNVPPTAKVIWRRGHGLKSHPTDWRSRESNLRPLVYKASGLSTTPQRLL